MCAFENTFVSLLKLGNTVCSVAENRAGGNEEWGESRHLAELTRTTGNRVEATHTQRGRAGEKIAAGWQLHWFYHHACLHTCVCLSCTVCKCETH